MPHWGMVIDLDRCIGCYACTVACHVENGSPPGIWYAPVYEQEVGTFPHVKRVFLPTLCMHCEDAPCMKACPSKAISRREDGIVLVDQDICCGTRACVTACPYGAMNFYGGESGDFDGQLTPYEQSLQGKYQVGTVQKCTFCVHRIDQGIFMPACVESCPTRCRTFGDLDDPESAPSKLIRKHNGFALRPEAGTSPSVRYVTPSLRSDQPLSDRRDISSRKALQQQAAGSAVQAGHSSETQAHSGNDFTKRLQVEAKPQNVRGFTVSLWYLFTGLAGGLYLNRLLFGIDMGQVLGLSLAHVLGIVLLGLSGLILIMDLGKPFRFLAVLRNVRSSWISLGAIADFVFVIFGCLLLLPSLTIGGQQPLAGMLWASGGSGWEPVLTWVVGAAALFIILYPGLELAASRSIPFWRTILVPLQFLGSALASAAGAAWVVSWLTNSPAPPRITAVVALVSLLATLLFSFIHIQSARSQQGAALMSADKVVRGTLAPYFLWGNLVFGLMMPGLILALHLAHALPGGVLVLAGVLLLAGNVLAKYSVLKAGYYASLL